MEEAAESKEWIRIGRLARLLESWDARLEATPAGRRAGLLDSLASGEFDTELPRRAPVRSSAGSFERRAR